MALNDHPSISAGTKARVWDAQRRLGYRPNPHARRLRRRLHAGLDQGLATCNLAFLLIDQTFEDPAYAPFFQGVSEVATEHQLHSFYHPFKEKDLLSGHLPALIRDRDVDGLLVSGYYGPVAHQVLKALNLPLVVLGNYDLKEPAMTIEVDFHQGMQLALERLHALGHGRVGYVSEIMDIHSSQQMLRAFKETSLRLWGGFDPTLVQVSGRRFEGGYEPVRRLLQMPNRPTALLFETERLTAAAYDLCADFKLRVPEDCSVISFGAGGTFYHYRPALTLMSVDGKALGREAANRLLELIRDPALPPCRTSFLFQISEGQSLAAAPTNPMPVPNS